MNKNILFIWFDLGNRNVYRFSNHSHYYNIINVFVFCVLKMRKLKSKKDSVSAAIPSLLTRSRQASPPPPPPPPPPNQAVWKHRRGTAWYDEPILLWFYLCRLIKSTECKYVGGGGGGGQTSWKGWFPPRGGGEGGGVKATVEPEKRDMYPFSLSRTQRVTDKNITMTMFDVSQILFCRGVGGYLWCVLII